MNELSTNWRTLRSAQARLENTKDCLNVVGSKDGKCCVCFRLIHFFPFVTHPPIVTGREILVPLTASLYVPGTICDSNKVLVDVGTGYFVEKTVPKAKELIERKVHPPTLSSMLLHDLASCCWN